MGGAHDWSHVATDLDALGHTVFEEVLGDDNSLHETTFDVFDAAVYRQFTNLYSAAGVLEGQTLVADDDRTIVTAWDPGIADWAVHQNVYGAGGLLVTETTLADDGSFAVTLGDGAAPMVLAASAGMVSLTSAGALADAVPILDLHAGSSVRWLANGLAMAEAPGAALLLVGAALLATNTSAGGSATTDLGGGVRLRFLDDGQPGVLEQQDADGDWVALGVGVSFTAGGTLTIDADALCAAVGEEAFADILAHGSIGDNGGPPGFDLSPVPVLASALASDSIFAGGSAATVYAIPGTTIDWSSELLQPAAGDVAVMEIHNGLTWVQGQATPIVGALSVSGTEATCPAWSSVVSTATSTDELIRNLPNSAVLSPQELGYEIHAAIALQVETWGMGFHAELGIDMDGNGLSIADVPFLPAGSSRLDILERTASNAICIYDIKTGDTPMSATQMSRYMEAAQRWAQTEGFVPTAIYVIPIYTRR